MRAQHDQVGTAGRDRSPSEGPEAGGRKEGGDGGVRTVRIAAMGDIHYDGHRACRVPELVKAVNEQADVLALCGDLTTHGEPEQIRKLLDLLEPLDVPAVAVLGNHDFEADRADEVTDLLVEGGVRVLDGEAVEIKGVGFAGVKGFAGGFGPGALGAFGEPLIKRFVQEGLDEALKLENALRKLATPSRVVLLHYSPVTDTLRGEPEVIFPYLGTSRLAQPIDALGADVVFHGHAHTGALEGSTPGGIPVYNVALPLLEADGRLFHLWEVEVPDRLEVTATR